MAIKIYLNKKIYAKCFIVILTAYISLGTIVCASDGYVDIDKNQQVFNVNQVYNLTDPQAIFDVGVHYFNSTDGNSKNNCLAYQYFSQAAKMGLTAAKTVLADMFVCHESNDKDTNDSAYCQNAICASSSSEDELSENEYLAMNNCWQTIYSPPIYKPIFSLKEKLDDNCNISQKLFTKFCYRLMQFSINKCELISNNHNKIFIDNCIWSVENFDNLNNFYFLKKEFNLSQAIKYGGTQAKYDLGMFYKDMSYDHVYAAKAYHWLNKAAEKYYAKAWYQLGLMYKDAEIVDETNVVNEPDHYEALAHFVKAAELGCKNAQFEIDKNTRDSCENLTNINRSAEIIREIYKFMN